MKAAKPLDPRVRACGRLEQWSVYRSDLKCYLNVNVSCLYSVRQDPNSAATIEKRVRLALSKRVIPENALLGCSIENSQSEKPFFKRQVWSLDDLPVESLNSQDSIEEVVCAAHNTALPNAQPWKVQILSANTSDAGCDKFWLSLTYHHAIADGSSGLAFHKQLLIALNESISETTTVSQMAPFPAPVEDCLNVQPGIRMLLGELWQILPLPPFVKSYFSPNCYLGKPNTLQQRVTTQCCLRSIVLTAESVAKLRGAAKSAAVRVHALLHAALAHTFAEIISREPELQRNIKSYTPINLRPLMKDQVNTFANYVSTHASELQPTFDLIETAKAFYKEINLPASRRKALGMLGLLRYIDNYAPRTHNIDATRNSVTVNGSLACTTTRHVAGLPNFIMQRLERSTDTSLSGTFEISNLGIWQPHAVPKESLLFAIEDAIFSGSNGPIGELMDLCVVTLADGPMRLVFSYRSSFLDEEMADCIVHLMKTHLSEF